MPLVEAKIIVLDKIILIYDMIREVCIVESLADYKILIPLKHANVLLASFNIHIADDSGFVIDVYMTPYTGFGFKNYYTEYIFSIKLPSSPSIKFDFRKKRVSIAHAKFFGRDFDILLSLSHWMLKQAVINPDIIVSTTFALDKFGQYQSQIPIDILAIIHDYIDGGFTAWDLARL